MFSIKVLNAISEKGLSRFDSDHYTVGTEVNDPDALLLRSADLHGVDIPESVLVVGRAGAGTNNIPIASCTERGIPVFNTPGANANAVKELVLTGLLLSSRHVLRAWDYVRQLTGTEEEQHHQVEKDKKQFVGSELPGRTLAVIGLGHIGIEVANCARYLGMNVIGYDPHMSVKNAWRLRSSVQQAESLSEAIAGADFVSLHVPLLPATAGFFDSSAFSQLKSGAVLLNFARAPLVDASALRSSLEENKLKCYVCDFPMPDFAGDDRVLYLPHLGASTLEAQENCAIMIANQVSSFLQDGHIEYSVNFPAVKMPRRGQCRISVVNHNVPNMLAQISSAVSLYHLNIVDMINKSRDDIAYTILDVDGECTEAMLQELSGIDGVIRTRVM